MPERMYLSDGGHKDLPAIKIVEPRTGLGWARALNDTRVYDLMDIAAGMSALLDNRTNISRAKFYSELERKGVQVSVTMKINSLTNGHLKPFDVFMAFNYTKLAKRYAELSSTEFDKIEELCAEGMGLEVDELILFRSRMDIQGLISKFAESMIDASRGELILRKWHDAMNGNSHAATFFLNQKSSKDVNINATISSAIDPTRMGEEEMAMEVRALRKKLGKPVIDVEFTEHGESSES